jgi:hypothetical protein
MEMQQYTVKAISVALEGVQTTYLQGAVIMIPQNAIKINTSKDEREVTPGIIVV